MLLGGTPMTLRLHRRAANVDNIAARRGPRCESVPTSPVVALDEVHDHLQTALAHTPIVLFSLDEQGIIDMAEGSGIGSLGAGLHEGRGTSIFEVYRAHPWVTDAAHRALAGETVSTSGKIRGAWLEAHFIPVRAAGGRVTGLFGIATDVTARRRAQEALEQQQSVLKYVIANVPHAIFWKDRECRFLGGNHLFLNDTGTVLETLVGKTDYDVWERREDADAFVQIDKEVMASGTPRLDIEETLLRSDGQQRVLLTSKVPIRDEAGRVTGLLGIYADITERKQMEVDLQNAKEAADAAARAKGEFLTTMSHELRTPLSLILGPLASLLSNHDEEMSPRVRADLERIQRNARRLHRLVDDILDHQKIESGKMTLDWEAVDVVELCRDMIEGAHPAAARGGIHLSMKADPELRSVPLDRRKFEKILLNLLGNALKFTPEEGRVSVELCALGDRMELAVTDTGPGIPEGKRHLLFQRFQQIDASPTRKHEGTGIGLSLVKDLTEMMGGAVGVTSEVGVGSRFFVTLPRAPDRLVSAPSPRGPAPPSRGDLLDAPAPRAVVAASPARRPASASASRVLVVEDNPDMRAYLSDILIADHEIDLATNGREALLAIEARRPDIIVSDVMMPEMDGFELVARLKRDPALRDIPVILLTARAGRKETVGGLDAGADDYLCKPFDPTELLARVRAAERLYRAHRDLAAKNEELATTLRRLSETQDELIQAGKMAAVGTLLAGLSHELNNPVAIILMKAQLLLQQQRAGAVDGAVLERSLSAIEGQANRCSSLVRALLEHTRRKPATREPCDLGAALSRVLEISGPQARDRGVDLKPTDLAPSLPPLLANPTQLDSALLNVIGNAIAAVSPGGSVVIRARPLVRRGVPGVGIEVRDTGCGIPAEDLEHIFEPFFTTKPPGQGTGLGLSLTQRFFDDHQGDIRVESEVSVGTTVFMWLPAAENRSEVETPAAGGGSS
ncbi:ATPase-like:Histidine kinase A [Minicystis rosea]|nr:ATPase-like:Histidine kinase A [Minicystis rosea]